MMLANPVPIKQLADEIERTGYSVVQNFLDEGVCAALATECRALHADRQLRPAAIGHGETRGEHRKIRLSLGLTGLLPRASAPHWRGTAAHCARPGSGDPRHAAPPRRAAPTARSAATTRCGSNRRR